MTTRPPSPPANVGDRRHVDRDDVVASAEPVGSRRAMVAATVGHAIEFYDYGLFASFSAVIATVFFPATSSLTGLMYAFAIYGVAYVARPVGAVVFGHLGDRIGRKRTLSTAILMMVGATVLIGVTPPYSSIGSWAAVILCIGRILQGISLGGELGGAMSYLVELAPRARRGLYGSWQAFAGGCGLLLGALAGTAITAFLSAESVEAWGWRAAFLLAAPIGLVGLYIRLQLEESPAFRNLESKQEIARAPVLEMLREHRRSMAVAVGLVVLFTVSTATWQVYMPGYLVKGVGVSPNGALSTLAVSLLAYVAVIPIIGHLSDRIGRRPIILVGSIGMGVLSYPGFMAIQTGVLPVIYVVSSVMFILMACVTTTVPIVLAEYFPARIRSSGVAICYAFPVAALGGTAPLVQTWLTAATENPLAPAYYVIVCAIVSIVLTRFVVRETARDHLGFDCRESA